MTAKLKIFSQALAVMAFVWASVFAVRSFAGSKKITSERIKVEMSELSLADWSKEGHRAAGWEAEAQRRREGIREIAAMINRLDFAEREKNRENRIGEKFFERLSSEEKEFFIEETIVETMTRFMSALDQMPPEQRKNFVDRGMKEIANGRTAEEMERAEGLSENLLTRIGQEGMRAYFEEASVETKLDLAPLMEAMNEIMQGMRGTEFGPR